MLERFEEVRSGLLDLYDENLLAPTDMKYIRKMERFIDDAQALALELEQRLNSN